MGPAPHDALPAAHGDAGVAGRRVWFCTRRRAGGGCCRRRVPGRAEPHGGGVGAVAGLAGGADFFAEQVVAAEGALVLAARAEARVATVGARGQPAAMPPCGSGGSGAATLDAAAGRGAASVGRARRGESARPRGSTAVPECRTPPCDARDAHPSRRPPWQSRAGRRPRLARHLARSPFAARARRVVAVGGSAPPAARARVASVAGGEARRGVRAARCGSAVGEAAATPPAWRDASAVLARRAAEARTGPRHCCVAAAASGCAWPRSSDGVDYQGTSGGRAACPHPVGCALECRLCRRAPHAARVAPCCAGDTVAYAARVAQ